MTPDQLKKIFAHAKAEVIEAFIAPLNRVMVDYEINSILRQAHFLAQVGHESGELRYREEIVSGAAYDTGKLAVALGNTPEDDGDGEKFKGRGLIQLTGRANYAAYGTFKGIFLLDKPELVAADIELCTDVAGWFWMKRNLNAWADKDDIRTITKRINGGLNGLANRKRLYALAISVLKEVNHDRDPIEHQG
jgi:putative chitinase